MQIEIPDQTVYDVQAMLSLRGDSSDVSSFVDRTLQRTLFFETVRQVKQQNAEADPEELDRLIDEAVSAARSKNRGVATDANGA